MKRISLDIAMWVVPMLGVGLYLLIAMAPVATDRGRPLIITFACLSILTAILLAVRFRWSPELVGVIALASIASGVHSIINQTGNGWWACIGGVCILTGYPGLRNDVRGKTSFVAALRRAQKSGADLGEELKDVDTKALTEEEDADAVCDFLERLLDEPALGGENALWKLGDFIDDIEDLDSPAFEVFAVRGVDLLLRIGLAGIEDPDRYDVAGVLNALQIAVKFDYPGSTDAVIRAARLPLDPDNYKWSCLFGAFSKNHPERERLWADLGTQPPIEDIASALCAAANELLLEGVLGRHPFDSPAGAELLSRWLTPDDEDDEATGRALNAAVATAFIDHPAHEQLFQDAVRYSSSRVRLEGAWAAAKKGRRPDIDWLAGACLDVNTADRAKQYLRELGLESEIPAASEGEEFRAKAAFAEWLAHPNELGRTPDELEVYAHRELKWPPNGESKSLWLIRFRAKDKNGLKEDDIDVGMVGSFMFCLFTYRIGERPPEDGFAIHAYWEMQQEKLIEEDHVEEGSIDFDSLLSQNPFHDLLNPRMEYVAEISPKLNFGRSQVGLASGHRGNEPGWVVLDGERSHWYAKSEMPPESYKRTVLMIHVGRILLHFTDEPDRKGLLKRIQEQKRPFMPGKRQAQDPEIEVRRFDEALSLAKSDLFLGKKLIRDGLLNKKFKEYVSARSALRNQDQAGIVIETYEAILAATKAMPKYMHKDAFDSLSAVSEHFLSYVQALSASGRGSEIPELIDRFRPFWKHPHGYRLFANAAIQAGRDDLAERWFSTWHDESKSWPGGEDGDLLAELWVRRGKADDARRHLIAEMKEIASTIHKFSSAGKDSFEESFQHHRATYLKLFPKEGEESLRREGIPTSALTQIAES